MEIKPSESIGAEGRPNTSLSETPRHVCVRVCVCMRECISRPKFSACVLGVMLRVCGCQQRGRELTNRNVAAVSYKVGGWLDVGVPWPAGGEEGLYVPTCVSAAAGRQAGQPHGCEKGCGGRCIGNRERDDQMHYWSAAWNIGMNYWGDSLSAGEWVRVVVEVVVGTGLDTDVGETDSRAVFELEMRFAAAACWNQR